MHQITSNNVLTDARFTVIIVQNIVKSMKDLSNDIFVIAPISAVISTPASLLRVITLINV